MSERVRYDAEGDGVYRVAGHQFEPGDCKTVPDDLAEHLLETEQFEPERATTVEYREVEETAASQIADGVCPWCDGYEGENVGLHASQAHPDDWADYNED